MIKSDLCEILGIEYPIIQGGMAWVADAVLAASVSNAGGLGLIAAMNSNGEQLRAEIRKAKELTVKPFGVNIMLMSPFVKETAQVVIEEKVEVVTTGAGNPGKYMDAWIAAGIKVIPVIPSVAFARRLCAHGAVAIVAEGMEAGGHIGEITTMVLVPQVAAAVDIPVIAAGGIADGRGVAAAFMLGAQGVQVGTRFLVADECRTHDNYKQRVIKAKDRDTIVTGRRLGHPVRSLKSPFSKHFREFEKDVSHTLEELETLGVGALRMAVLDGDELRGCFMAGQSAALVSRRQSSKEIITEMFDEAEILLKGAGKWVK
ncbi:MAG: enoyl-[acyl-carrier-protein] reductase FabK [Saccharofermentanales bacterium]